MDDESDRSFAKKPDISTAWRRIADSIAEDVARGAWGSGDTLPPAQDLAQHYGVHRHTVRQAYKHLQERGIVNIRQGLGTFVASPPLPYRLGPRVRFRENLHDFGITAESRLIGTEVLTAGHIIGRDIGIGSARTVWHIQLVHFASAAPVSLSHHYLATAHFPKLPDVLARSELSFSACFKALGFETYERRSTRISARLTSLFEQEQLDLADGSAVLTTRAIDVNEGKTLQLVETVFRPDRIELLVEQT